MGGVPYPAAARFSCRRLAVDFHRFCSGISALMSVAVRKKLSLRTLQGELTVSLFQTRAPPVFVVKRNNRMHVLRVRAGRAPFPFRAPVLVYKRCGLRILHRSSLSSGTQGMHHICARLSMRPTRRTQDPAEPTAAVRLT